jgi:diguanylate cyclase (GGDEF)-like protein
LGDNKETLDQLRERVYLIVLLFGAFGASIALVAYELAGNEDPFIRGVLILSVVILLLHVWALRSATFGIRVVERTLYVAVTTIAVSNAAYALYVQPSRALAQASLLGQYLWLPVVFAFLFLVYESRAALVRSVILYLLLVCVSLPELVLAASSGVGLEVFNTLGQVYLANAATIAALYFFTRLKGQLARARAIVEQMTELARTDVLTGLSNRRHAEEVLSDETARSQRYGHPLSVILFDLDDFKSLNDDLGHDAGDRVLKEVARLIEPHLRTTDRLARWGGEEFLIVATETPAQATGMLANRIRSAINAHPFEGDRRVSASFSVASYRKGDDPVDMIKRADVALYRAKALGKNRVEGADAA